MKKVLVLCSLLACLGLTGCSVYTRNPNYPGGPTRPDYPFNPDDNDTVDPNDPDENSEGWKERTFDNLLDYKDYIFNKKMSLDYSNRENFILDQKERTIFTRSFNNASFVSDFTQTYETHFTSDIIRCINTFKGDAKSINSDNNVAEESHSESNTEYYETLTSSARKNLSRTVSVTKEDGKTDSGYLTCQDANRDNILSHFRYSIPKITEYSYKILYFENIISDRITIDSYKVREKNNVTVIDAVVHQNTISADGSPLTLSNSYKATFIDSYIDTFKANLVNKEENGLNLEYTGEFKVKRNAGKCVWPALNESVAKKVSNWTNNDPLANYKIFSLLNY